MGVELWANHMGLKPRFYWEHLGGCIWEHDENTSIWERGKTKNPSLSFKNKKTGPFMSAC
jgi:hypothetical protein